MYIQTIPLTHTLSTEALTYTVGDIFRHKLEVWSLVSVPFGKKEVMGIVSKVDVPPPQKRMTMREVSAVITSHAIIAPTTIRTIIWLSKKYIIPLGKVGAFFLPVTVIRRLEKQGFPVFPSTHPPCPSHEIVIAQDRVISGEDFVNRLPWPSVILCPDDIFLESIRSYFSPEDTLILRQDATPARRAQAWIDIALGKYQRIVWTRHLLYYNLTQYPHICYVEDSFSPEHYHYPIRIQYSDLLGHIVDAQYHSLHIYTSAPRLITLSRFHYFPIHYIYTACPKNSTSFSPDWSDISKLSIVSQ